MSLAVGTKIPSVTLFENTVRFVCEFSARAPAAKTPPPLHTNTHAPLQPGGGVSTDELFAGKKVVIFGVPGAFTPGCSKTHLPGYIKDADRIKGKGIAEIVWFVVRAPAGAPSPPPPLP